MKQCPYALLLTLALLAASQQPAASRMMHSAASVFDQISVDLSPYKKTGISASMIQGVYCGIRDPGFRVQIINQEIFIVGEVQGFQSRNRNIKLALVDLASTYKALPDVDFVIGTYDWTATTVQETPEFEAGGPVLAQVCTISSSCSLLLMKLLQAKQVHSAATVVSSDPDRTQPQGLVCHNFMSVYHAQRMAAIYASSKAACSCPEAVLLVHCHLQKIFIILCPLQAKKSEHTHAVLYPDHTFIDWQEADTTSWPRQQYIMHRSVSGCAFVKIHLLVVSIFVN